MPKMQSNGAAPQKAITRRPEAYKNGVPQTFVDRDLAKVNPLQEQFAPSDGEAVRQHYKMAGGC